MLTPSGFGTVGSHLGLPDAGLASYRDMVERVGRLQASQLTSFFSGRRSGPAIDSSLEQEGAGCVKPRAPGGARVEMSRSEGANPHGPHVSARHLRRRHRLWWPTECDSVQSKCKSNRKYLEYFAAASAGMSRFLRGMVWKRADAVA